MSELGETLGLCVCANESALRLLRDIMRLANEKPPNFGAGNRELWDDWYFDWSARQEAIAPGPMWELMMHFLDAKEWAEHGGGINSSWLTSEGKAILAKLEAMWPG